MSEENVETVHRARIAIRPLSQRATRRRSMDQRLCVRQKDFLDRSKALEAAARA